MFRVCIVAVLILCATATADDRWPVMLSPQISINLDHAVNSVKYIQLAQLNSSPEPEVVVWTENKVQVYSPSSAQPIRTILYAADTVLCARAGNLIGDARSEIVIVHRGVPSGLKVPWVIDLIDPSNSYTVVRTKSILQADSGMVGCGFEDLQLVDTDGNGVQEILVSFGNWYEKYNEIGQLSVGGLVLLYRDFPTTIKWKRNTLLVDAQMLTGPGVRWIVGHNPFYHFAGTGIDVTRFGESLVILDSSGTIKRGYGAGSYTGCSPSPWVANFYSSVSLLNFGRIDTTRAGITALFSFNWSSDCSPATGPTISAGGSGMFLYEFKFDGMVNEVWTKSSGILFGNNAVTYNPLFPGNYIGIRNAGLSLMRGFDNVEVGRFSPLPTGSQRWLNSTFYSQPLLVSHDQANITLYSIDVPTDVENDSKRLPESFVLNMPYPNPFNGTVVFPVSIDRRQHLRIDIVNMLGQCVATAADEDFAAGSHLITWDSRDLPSGVYLARAQGETGAQVRKLLHLK